MQIYKTASIILFLSLGIAGCATTSKTATNLDSRLGYMTYEESLQRFGPPTQCADAGSTKTCDWVQGTDGTMYIPMRGNDMAVPTQAPKARLTFTDGVLSSWELWGNWQ